MEKKLDVRKWVDNKRYPYYLGGILMGATIVMILLLALAHGATSYYWTMFGAELLLFMLLNAFSCLITKHLGYFLKRLIIIYVINLGVITGLIYVLMGEHFKESEHTFPAFEALIFCFFSSLVLIALIRSVVNFFKNENI